VSETARGGARGRLASGGSRVAEGFGGRALARRTETPGPRTAQSEGRPKGRQGDREGKKKWKAICIPNLKKKVAGVYGMLGITRLFPGTGRERRKKKGNTLCPNCRLN